MTKRSLSLRSSSFIRLLSPFRGARPAGEEEGSLRRGQAALSDTQLDRRGEAAEEGPWVAAPAFRGPWGILGMLPVGDR